jgi:hypothetical protein
MKPPIKTRAVALLASICMTLATVWSIAEHAYPQAPALLLASAR